jgi:hypothetical protein
MIDRRTALSLFGFCVTTSLTGCLDTITGGESELGGIGSGVQQEQREIVTTYDDALTARNDAIETRDTGIKLFNAKEYARAMESIETALGGYEEAESGFAEAAELATALTEEEAASICELARDEARFQVEATEAALAAATAAEEDADASTINEHVREFQDVKAEADALTVEDTEVLAETLGIQ